MSSEPQLREEQTLNVTAERTPTSASVAMVPKETYMMKANLQAVPSVAPVPLMKSKEVIQFHPPTPVTKNSPVSFDFEEAKQNVTSSLEKIVDLQSTQNGFGHSPIDPALETKPQNIEPQINGLIETAIKTTNVSIVNEQKQETIEEKVLTEKTETSAEQSTTSGLVNDYAEPKTDAKHNEESSFVAATLEENKVDPIVIPVSISPNSASPELKNEISTSEEKKEITFEASVNLSRSTETDVSSINTVIDMPVDILIKNSSEASDIPTVIPPNEHPISGNVSDDCKNEKLIESLPIKTEEKATIESKESIVNSAQINKSAEVNLENSTSTAETKAIEEQMISTNVYPLGLGDRGDQEKSMENPLIVGGIVENNGSSQFIVTGIVGSVAAKLKTEASEVALKSSDLEKVIQNSPLELPSKADLADFCMLIGGVVSEGEKTFGLISGLVANPVILEPKDLEVSESKIEIPVLACELTAKPETKIEEITVDNIQGSPLPASVTEGVTENLEEKQVNAGVLENSAIPEKADENKNDDHKLVEKSKNEDDDEIPERPRSSADLIAAAQAAAAELAALSQAAENELLQMRRSESRKGSVLDQNNETGRTRADSLSENSAQNSTALEITPPNSLAEAPVPDLPVDKTAVPISAEADALKTIVEATANGSASDLAKKLADDEPKKTQEEVPKIIVVVENKTENQTEKKPTESEVIEVFLAQPLDSKVEGETQKNDTSSPETITEIKVEVGEEIGTKEIQEIAVTIVEEGKSSLPEEISKATEDVKVKAGEEKGEELQQETLIGEQKIEKEKQEEKITEIGIVSTINVEEKTIGEPRSLNEPTIVQVELHAESTEPKMTNNVDEQSKPEIGVTCGVVVDLKPANHTEQQELPFQYQPPSEPSPAGEEKREELQQETLIGEQKIEKEKQEEKIAEIGIVSTINVEEKTIGEPRLLNEPTIVQVELHESKEVATSDVSNLTQTPADQAAKENIENLQETLEKPMEAKKEETEYKGVELSKANETQQESNFAKDENAKEETSKQNFEQPPAPVQEQPPTSTQIESALPTELPKDEPQQLPKEEGKTQTKEELQQPENAESAEPVPQPEVKEAANIQWIGDVPSINPAVLDGRKKEQFVQTSPQLINECQKKEEESEKPSLPSESVNEKPNEVKTEKEEGQSEKAKDVVEHPVKLNEIQSPNDRSEEAGITKEDEKARDEIKEIEKAAAQPQDIQKVEEIKPDVTEKQAENDLKMENGSDQVKEVPAQVVEEKQADTTENKKAGKEEVKESQKIEEKIPASEMIAPQPTPFEEPKPTTKPFEPIKTVDDGIEWICDDTLPKNLNNLAASKVEATPVLSKLSEPEPSNVVPEVAEESQSTPKFEEVHKREANPIQKEEPVSQPPSQPEPVQIKTEEESKVAAQVEEAKQTQEVVTPHQNEIPEDATPAKTRENYTNEAQTISRKDETSVSFDIDQYERRMSEKTEEMKALVDRLFDKTQEAQKNSEQLAKRVAEVTNGEIPPSQQKKRVSFDAVSFGPIGGGLPSNVESVILGKGVLSEPTGVDILPDGNVLVTDKQKGIFIFSIDGSIVKQVENENWKDPCAPYIHRTYILLVQAVKNGDGLWERMICKFSFDLQLLSRIECPMWIKENMPVIVSERLCVSPHENIYLAVNADKFTGLYELTPGGQWTELEYKLDERFIDICAFCIVPPVTQILVVEGSKNYVHMYSIINSQVAERRRMGVVERPGAITQDEQGNLFVLNKAAACIFTVDTFSWCAHKAVTIVDQVITHFACSRGLIAVPLKDSVRVQKYEIRK